MGRRTIVLLVAVFALMLAACGSGIETSVSGTDEGIQVHGQWVIEIYNEDGTLDQRHEFDNALNSNGANTIASVLSSFVAAGNFTVLAFDV